MYFQTHRWAQGLFVFQNDFISQGSWRRGSSFVDLGGWGICRAWNQSALPTAFFSACAIAQIVDSRTLKLNSTITQPCHQHPCSNINPSSTGIPGQFCQGRVRAQTEPQIPSTPMTYSTWQANETYRPKVGVRTVISNIQVDQQLNYCCFQDTYALCLLRALSGWLYVLLKYSALVHWQKCRSLQHTEDHTSNSTLAKNILSLFLLR